MNQRLSRAVVVAITCLSQVAKGQERPTVVLPDEIGLASKVGRAVRIHENVLLASSGQTVVHFELKEGTWEQRGVILPSAEDHLPEHIILNERYAAVTWKAKSHKSAREIHIYTRREERWHRTHTIQGAPVGGTPEFGEAVAGDTDRLAVGDPGYLRGDQRIGAVHIFRRGDGGWDHETTLTSPDDAETDRLGTRLSLDNDRCVASGYRTAQEIEEGLPHSVMVFCRSSDEWRFETSLRSKQAERPGLFASCAVAIAEDLIVIGNQCAFDTSGAVVFMLIDGTWKERHFLGCLPEHAAIFGTDLAATKDMVAVGAPLYVFLRSTKWGLVLVNDDFRASATEFSISANGSHVALGLPRDSANDLPSGRVDVWTAPFDDIPPPLDPDDVERMSAAAVEARMMWVTAAMYSYGEYDHALRDRLSRDFDVLMKKQLDASRESKYQSPILKH